MKIEIKEPCHENWNSMKIGVTSRHCGVCVKNVIDFTSQSRAEIITYLIDKKDESVCGRMRRDQFDFHHSDIPVIVELLKTRPSSNAFLILALVSLSLSSCSQETVKPISQPQTIISTPERLQVPIMGKMVSPVIPIDTIIEPIKCMDYNVVGEIAIAPDDNDIKGKIAISPPQSLMEDEVNALKFAEKMPEFPGGIDRMYQFVNDFFSGYKKQPKSGTAYVRFIVLKSGKLASSEVINLPDDLRYLEQDLLNMINKMPNWIAGENEGTAVDVYYTMPVIFR